jgi:hypothetical protein
VVTHWCIVVSQAEPAGQSPVMLQPHEPPLASPMQTAPIELDPQGAQAAPESPHLAVAVPSTQVPPEQQPPLHSWVGEQVATHRCVPVLHAESGAQSAGTLQPQAPATQACPEPLAEQSRQALPLPPQALPLIPDEQTVPAQQPPLQGWLESHCDPHRWLALLQACPEGQSGVALQPQAPPATVAMQRLPLAPPHERQAPPESPHAELAVPPTQRMPLQQPPLQICPALQPIAQAWSTGSQAWPTGQSLGPPQPQTPPTQAVPPPCVAQSRHSLPLAPHALWVLPGWHTPFLQQAPEQGCVGLQVVTQAWAVRSQADPGQSFELLQPQPLAPQIAPRLLVEQSTQAAPATPQALSAVPSVQVPL